MFKYIVKRLLISVLILFGVSLILYILVRLMPMDYIDIKFASQLNQGTITLEDIQRYKDLYGIGDNSFKGIVGGYFKWLGKLCIGDLGYSFQYEKEVSTVIVENMWISFGIAFVATILQFFNRNPAGNYQRDPPVFGQRLHGNRAHYAGNFSAHILLRRDCY